MLITNKLAYFLGQQFDKLSYIGPRANDASILIVDGLSAEWARVVALLDPLLDAPRVEEVLLVAVEASHVLAVFEQFEAYDAFHLGVEEASAPLVLADRANYLHSEINFFDFFDLSLAKVLDCFVNDHCGIGYN